MLIDIITGLILIVIGVLIIIYNYKNPNTILVHANLGAYIGGAAFIVVGIMCISGNGGNITTGVRNLIENVKTKF